MCCVIVRISVEYRPTDGHAQDERKRLKDDARSSSTPGRLVAYVYDTNVGDWTATSSDDEGDARIMICLLQTSIRN